MNNLKKLPIGLSSFELIRTEKYLYVDKTKSIAELIEKGAVYFLSRPRRFGKSLLISTLRDLFQGKRELFKDLWIEKNYDWEWKQHPVIVFDFNSISYSSPEELKSSLIETLETNAEENGFALKSKLLKSKFKELILKLKEKNSENVIILVDEYDKPIIDFLGEGDDEIQLGIKNRGVLKSFYGVLKDADVVSALRFVLITGISKFSRVSLFSELNNLYDLTMSEECSDLLGYTHEELESYFETEIKALADKFNISESEMIGNIKHWYNGYRFSDQTTYVYNPFSVLKLFRSLCFKNYWFESGSPSFLIKLIKEKGYFPPKLEKIEVSEEVFSTFDIENLNLEAIFFQTGYLTIKDVNGGLYTLTYPNHEVRNSLTKSLFNALSEISDTTERSKILLLGTYLKEKKYDDFFKTVKSLYASIPYTINSKRDEAYWHTIFYLMITASGLEAQNELLTCHGRIDMVMEFCSFIYIIEFKCNGSAKKALGQIREKRYYERYLSTGKEIYLVGINFSTEEKSVVEWEVERF